MQLPMLPAGDFIHFNTNSNLQLSSSVSISYFHPDGVAVESIKNELTGPPLSRSAWPQRGPGFALVYYFYFHRASFPSDQLNLHRLGNAFAKSFKEAQVVGASFVTAAVLIDTWADLATATVETHGAPEFPRRLHDSA